MPFDSRDPADTSARDRRAVARWLLFVAGLVWVMVVIGGATRLTGSGLSIMEWAPHHRHAAADVGRRMDRLYELYRTIPQYQLVNQGFGWRDSRKSSGWNGSTASGAG
jgi:cytochrome c oxidase assembly protein subunit 15